MPLDSDRELLKGNTQTLVLAILREQPLHGYAIAREIERRSKTGLKFLDGTLYPALKALENGGFIAGAWEPMENAPPRKVYRMKEEGLREFERRAAAWEKFARMIDGILWPQPARQPE
jgi:PadR family transcriptional regulator PadR